MMTRLLDRCVSTGTWLAMTAIVMGVASFGLGYFVASAAIAVFGF